VNIDKLPIGIDELSSITTDVWNTYVGEGAAMESLEAPDVAPDERMARVDISGSVFASVVIRCDSGSASGIARRLFELDPGEQPAQADVDDALGELANIVGGNIKSLADGEAALTLPIVGSADEIFPGLDAIACSADMFWEDGRANLSVWSVTPAAPVEVPAATAV
jgi:chemotaxis protein CheX